MVAVGEEVMQKKFLAMLIFFVVVVSVAGYFWLHWARDVESGPQNDSLSSAQPAATLVPSMPSPAAPAIINPLAFVPTAEPLPELDASESEIFEALLNALGVSWKDLLVSEALIRKVVATVDHLPRPLLPANIVPLKRARGGFLVTGEPGNETINPENFQRYVVYVRLFSAIDTAKLVSVYRLYYPLFQRAYTEIAQPGAYFNDRLVVAIDDLLAAPESESTIPVVQTKVLYQYADPAIEARSSGQKIMLRIGSENAALLKAKLHEIRLLVAHAP